MCYLCVYVGSFFELKSFAISHVDVGEHQLVYIVAHVQKMVFRDVKKVLEQNIVFIFEQNFFLIDANCVILRDIAENSFS